MGHKSLVVFYRTHADLLRPGAQHAAKRLGAYLAAHGRAAGKVAEMNNRTPASLSPRSARAPRKPRA